jgi:hypothetical protein
MAEKEEIRASVTPQVAEVAARSEARSSSLTRKREGSRAVGGVEMEAPNSVSGAPVLTRHAPVVVVVVVE